jgi:predicted AlkP superfamily phosphohydrolase/phosphomutase
MLPEMLRAVLDPDPARDEPAQAGSIWRLRAALPSGLRAKVAAALPEKVALEVTSRLEMRGVDWSATKAFAHPAENQGYIRLNLRGRERDGIVAPEEAKDVMEEITAGLLTFTELDGSPVIRSIERVADLFGTGERAHQLPDLIVKWVDTPATQVRGVRSERYGTVLRHGVGSGRSGNHTEGDAWALVVPGASTPAHPHRTPRLEDIAATAAALAGADTSAMAGQPLLRP